LAQTKLERIENMANRSPDQIEWLTSVPFFAMHAACVLIFWCGVSWAALATCAVLYIVRVGCVSAGFHRYFSHRSYKTTRIFQFVLAWIATSAVQKGPLWWAAQHRHHHAYSDTEADAHSPRRGFWWSHAGWFLSGRFNTTDFRLIPDFAVYPELRFLNDYHIIPPVVLAASVAAFGAQLQHHWPDLHTSALQMLIWGFLVSTVLGYHATYVVNSLAHVFGRRRFATRDDSRNNLLIALITFGEGWHNNHHYAPSSERQGFYWWEIDITHYVLTVLSWVGLVWDLNGPPQRVYTDQMSIDQEIARVS
jgi:stearoyl-CoA desaturase (delta-9 desaturase)